MILAARSLRAVLHTFADRTCVHRAEMLLLLGNESMLCKRAKIFSEHILSIMHDDSCAYEKRCSALAQHIWTSYV